MPGAKTLQNQQMELKRNELLSHKQQNPRSTVKELCEIVDIDVSSFYNWKYSLPEFRKAWEIIELEYQEALERFVKDMALVDPYLGLKVLEKIAPNKWGNKVQVDHTTLGDKINNTIQVEIMRTDKVIDITPHQDLLNDKPEDDMNED